jgi:hypothetical protein
MPDFANHVEPDINPSAGMTANVTPEEAGGGTAQGVGAIAGVENRMALDALRQQNAVKVMAGYNQLSDWENAKLYHPETGILNQNTGDQADKAIDDTLADYKKTVSGIAQGMGNNAQRDQFLRMANEHGQNVTRTLYTYAHKQNVDYADQQTAGFIKNATDAAAKDPGSAEFQVEKINAALLDAKARNATPPEMFQTQLRQQTSGVYSTAIDTMLSSGDIPGAQKMLAEHRDDLLPAQRDHFTKALAIGDLDAKAQATLPGIILGKDGQLVDRATALARLNGDAKLAADPKLHDAVQERMDKAFAEQRAADDETARTAHADAFKLATSGQEIPPNLQATLDKTPSLAEDVARAQANYRKGLQPQDGSDAYIIASARLERNEVDPVTGKRPSDEMPQKYRASMSSDDFNRYVHSWEAANGKAMKTAEDRGTETAGQIVADALKGAAIKEKLPNGDFNPDAVKFRRLVNDMVLANGGVLKLGTKGVQDICDNLTWQSVETKNTSAMNPLKWVGATDPTYQVKGPMRFTTMTPGQALTPKDIPDTVRATIVRKLEAGGLTKPSDDEVFHYYLRHPDGG